MDTGWQLTSAGRHERAIGAFVLRVLVGEAHGFRDASEGEWFVAQSHGSYIDRSDERSGIGAAGLMAAAEQAARATGIAVPDDAPPVTDLAVSKRIAAWMRGLFPHPDAQLVADAIESGEWRDPEQAPPFTQAERADVLAVASVPPRALRAVAEHLTRCAAKHGVEPHVTRPDRDAQAHMAGADRHLQRMARVEAPGYDLDAIDEDSGAPQLVAVASRVMLALECWLGEREGGRG